MGNQNSIQLCMSVYVWVYVCVYTYTNIYKYTHWYYKIRTFQCLNIIMANLKGTEKNKVLGKYSLKKNQH